MFPDDDACSRLADRTFALAKTAKVCPACGKMIRQGWALAHEKHTLFRDAPASRPADLGDGRDDPACQQAVRSPSGSGHASPDGDPLQRHLLDPAAPETARYRRITAALGCSPTRMRASMVQYPELRLTPFVGTTGGNRRGQPSRSRTKGRSSHRRRKDAATTSLDAHRIGPRIELRGDGKHPRPPAAGRNLSPTVYRRHSDTSSKPLVGRSRRHRENRRA